MFRASGKGAFIGFVMLNMVTHFILNPRVVAQPLSFDVWQAPITPISLLQMNEITLAVETVSLKRVCFTFEL